MAGEGLRVRRGLGDKAESDGLYSGDARLWREIADGERWLRNWIGTYLDYPRTASHYGCGQYVVPKRARRMSGVH